MLTYAVRRTLIAIPLLIGVTLVVFLILRLVPGDPAKALLFGSSPTPARLASVRHELGLDQSPAAQYWLYLRRLVHGNLGFSYATNTPVIDQLEARAPFTINLALLALAIGVGFGLVTGALAGLHPGSVPDRVATFVSVLGVAVPYFWLAEILIIVFAVKLGWLPALGTGSPQAIILPALALGLQLAAVITRLLRSSLIEVYRQPYMVVARAKGLSANALLIKHALRNAIGSVIAMIGVQVGILFGGAVAIEVIFGRPGIGQYLVASIQEKDIPSIQGIVLFVAIVYIGVNLLVDIAHGVLDPRVRTGSAR